MSGFHVCIPRNKTVIPKQNCNVLSPSSYPHISVRDLYISKHVSYSLDSFPFWRPCPKWPKKYYVLAIPFSIWPKSHKWRRWKNFKSWFYSSDFIWKLSKIHNFYFRGFTFFDQLTSWRAEVEDLVLQQGSLCLEPSWPPLPPHSAFISRETVYYTANEGRWESNINVRFSCMYSQK